MIAPCWTAEFGLQLIYPDQNNRAILDARDGFQYKAKLMPVSFFLENLV
jgi:hypothetical protein